MTRLTFPLKTLLAVVVSLFARGGEWLIRAARAPQFRPAVAALACAVAALHAPESLLFAPLAFGVLTEGMHTAEFLITEQPGRLSRTNVTVTVPASTTLRSGYVLGKITASGKYVPYDDASSDGREAAAGVLYNELVNEEVTAQDMDGVVIDFGAEVRSADLVWLDEDNDATTGLADLLGRFIKAR